MDIRKITDELSVAPQISACDIGAIAVAGFRAVICNRPDGESSDQPCCQEIETAVIANVFGYAVEDYIEVARVLEDAEGVAAYELNVSCPNTKHGGIFFSSDPVLLAEVVSAVRGVAKRPLSTSTRQGRIRGQRIRAPCLEGRGSFRWWIFCPSPISYPPPSH